MDPSVWQLSHYTGAPIDPDLEIRVLHLHPGRDEDDIFCSLETQPIDYDEHITSPETTDPQSRISPPAGRQYEALSYAWGDESDMRNIQFPQGGVVRVTRNLWHALRRLRQVSTTKQLWIDQLCIDQGCVEERNRQISHMECIYSHAQRVLIWLGDASVNVNQPPRSNHQRYQQLDEAMMTTKPSWWTRAWVVQEFANARNQRIFVFGTCQLDHLHFIDFIRGQWFARMSTFRSFRFKKIFAHFAVFNWLADEEFRQKSSTRVQLLTLTECRDPRDKVYSLLTFMTEQEKDYIQPNYEKTIDEVYAEATYAWIVAKGFSIMILVSAGDRDTRSMGSSWAIDFQTLRQDHLNLQPFTRLPYFKSGLRGWRPVEDDFGLDDVVTTPWLRRRPEVKPQQSFNLLPLTLAAKGLRFDRICCVFNVRMGSTVGAWAKSRLPLERPLFRRTPEEMALQKWIEKFICERDPYERVSTHEIPVTKTKTPVLQILQEDGITLGIGARCLAVWDTAVRGYPLFGTRDVGLNVIKMFHGATFFITEAGFLGLGPPVLQQEDLITLFYGCRTPAAIRKHGEDGAWKFESLVYVHAIMEGELLERLPDVEFEEREFVLR